MPYSGWIPLADTADIVLLVARVIMGGTMVYYGWQKVKDPRKNAFDAIAKAGFTPGWFWGSIILVTEFGGGIAVITGFYTWIAASLIGIEMLTGAAWKITKAHRPFAEYSYDLLVLGLALVLLAVGSGQYSLT